MSGTDNEKRELEKVGAELGMEEMSRRIQEAEAAARDWGIDPNEVEGKFVSAVLWALRSVGTILVAGINDVRNIVASAKELAELELEKLRKYNRAAAMSIQQAQEAKDLVIARVAEGLSSNLANRLVDGSRDFLVLKETARNRREAWKLAGIVSVCALLLFGAGYELRAFQDDPITSALSRCARHHLVAQMDGQFFPICKVEEVTAQPKGSLSDRLAAYFWYGTDQVNADTAKAGKS